eukprot:ANDGO_01906.mRNA.1 hypothetical protein
MPVQCVYAVLASGVFGGSLAQAVAESACYVQTSGSLQACVSLDLGRRAGQFTAWIMMFSYALIAVQALL